jgi:deoxyribodipyrimidine photolyase
MRGGKRSGSGEPEGPGSSHKAQKGAHGQTATATAQLEQQEKREEEEERLVESPVEGEGERVSDEGAPEEGAEEERERGAPAEGNGGEEGERQKDRDGSPTSEAPSTSYHHHPPTKGTMTTVPALPPMMQTSKMGRVAVWFRRDLRLDDNPALMAACRAGREVVPLFIWAPEEEGVFTPGLSSRWWLKSSLKSLSEKIEFLGSRLVFSRAQTSKQAIVPFVKDNNIDAVFFNHLYDPISLVRDKGIRMLLQSMNIHVESFGADLMYEPWEVLDEKGQPFCTFDKFWSHVVNKMPYEPFMPLPTPVALPKLDPSVKGNRETLEQMEILSEDEIETCEHLGENWMPGSDSAKVTSKDFIFQKLHFFKTQKHRVYSDCTSKLSPHLHYGEISVSSLCSVLKGLKMTLDGQGQLSEQHNKSINCFMKHLGYREYSRYILFHNPFTHEKPLLEHLGAVPWQYDQDLFKCWQQGCTGYPLIDAGMQQLWSTGWCHNRLRLLVGHFFVKYLNLPWQWGLKYFWDTLIDADLECDALGWQHLSGCMIDAHPFSYIMDYEEECSKFDPEGKFVKKWLPLLSRIPAKYVHNPWKAPAQVLRSAGVELGITYPHRVVNLDQVRRSVKHCCECLDKFKSGPQQGPFRHPTRSSDPSNHASASLLQSGGMSHEQFQKQKTAERDDLVSISESNNN